MGRGKIQVLRCYDNVKSAQHFPKEFPAQGRGSYDINVIEANNRF